MKPWPGWLFNVEMASYGLWRAFIGAAYGLGIGAASGWVFWFLIAVAAAWFLDRMLMFLRKSNEPPSVAKSEAMTLSGLVKLSGDDVVFLVKLSGDDVVRLQEMIDAAKAKQGRPN